MRTIRILLQTDAVVNPWRPDGWAGAVSRRRASPKEEAPNRGSPFADGARKNTAGSAQCDDGAGASAGRYTGRFSAGICAYSTAASQLPPEEKAALDARMGLGAVTQVVTENEYKLTLGAFKRS